MSDVSVEIKLDGGVIPTGAYEESAAVDIISPETVSLFPGRKPKMVDLKFATAFNSNVGALIIPRSGLGCKGLYISNTAGLIDSDYRGNWKLSIGLHQWAEPMTIHKGVKFAQVMFINVHTPVFNELVELQGTLRGLGGFGSSDEVKNA